MVPTDVIHEIIKFIQPANFTTQGVMTCARKIINISLINKNFNTVCIIKLTDLKIINHLVNQYVYNDDYEQSLEWQPSNSSIWNKYYFNKIVKQQDWRNEATMTDSNPQLYDMLCTGLRLPYAKASFNVYNQEIEQDIKTILKLTPQSIHCRLGMLRCRNQVLPLSVACMNEHIPITIIQLLLQSGAHLHDTILLNGYPITIIDDLKDNCNPKRYQLIKNLL